MQISDLISQHLPHSLVRFVLVCLAVIVLSLVFRLIFGPGSQVNHALCCAIGIVMIYAVDAVIYTLKPGFLSALFSPLPFIRFSGDRLELFSFLSSPLSESCGQILSMVILAFLVCLTDSIMPQGKGIGGWIFTRFLNVVLALGAHYLLLQIFRSLAVGFIQTWAPMILLGLLVFMLLLGAVKLALGVVLTIINPLLGAAYAFFFSSLIGKQLSKAVLATAVLVALVLILENAGIHSLAIHTSALVSYIPTAAILAGIWFLIGHKL